MPTHQQHKSTHSSKVARWWLALMGVVLFSISVASDYRIQHVVGGAIIVVAIHFLVAIFRRDKAANVESAVHRAHPSNARALALLLPLAVGGVVGLLTGGSSIWHPYFCALAVGSFTAMCWLFPSRAKKNGATAAPDSSRS